MRASLAFAMLCLTVLPGRVMAQAVDVKAGLTFAELRGEIEDDDASRRIGLTGGFAIRPSTPRRATLQLEVLFVEKGEKFPWGSLRWRYIEVPVLGRLELGPLAAPRRGYVIGGIAPALKLSTQQVIEDSTNNLDDIESFDAGIVAGAGFQADRTFIEARYTHGLMTTHHDESHHHINEKHRVFSVAVGYRLR